MHVPTDTDTHKEIKVVKLKNDKDAVIFSSLVGRWIYGVAVSRSLVNKPCPQQNTN